MSFSWPWKKDSSPSISAESMQEAKIAELALSRRSIADAYEIERQRIERDLHDGTQQYLVAAGIKLGELSLYVEGESLDLVESAKKDINDALVALRSTVQGITPQILQDRGLVAAIKNVAASHRLNSSVYSPHPLPTLSPSVLAAGYFFASEVLTNVAKYAPHSQVSIVISSDRDLRISIVDDGSGGAVIIPGHGLHGIKERLESFGGQLSLSSPPGGPTAVTGCIPLLLNRGESGLGSRL